MVMDQTKFSECHSEFHNDFETYEGLCATYA